MMHLEFEITGFDAAGKVVSSSTGLPGWRRSGGRYENAELGLGFSVEFEQLSSGIRMKIPAFGITESPDFRFRTLAVLLPGAAGCENDGGALVLPLDSGML